MKKNLGMFDRVTRVVLVLALCVAAWYWSSWILVIVAVLLALEALTGWCWLYRLLGISTAKVGSPPPASPPSYDEAARRAVGAVAEGHATLLDVRTREEWDAGHAKDAMHWPLDRLERGEVPDLPKDRPIYTHCMAGARAARAAELLTGNGFTNVTCMGGLSDWTGAGGAIAS